MADGSGEIDIKALPRMVRWYSPAHLVSTGWRSVVSEIFGQYADQRIMQATIDGFAPEVVKEVVGRYDYSDLRHLSDGNAVWVDYIADLGDGFDSTYAMASLVSAPQITVEGAGTLPGGKLLIMGGDQVYPFPTRQAYRERFAMPYSTALPPSPDGNWRRLLFVLPGNHDWYDGLSSFDHMFCKARFGRASENRIGGWLCPQHRSYFAIRLPHNWWIWGADIQLAQYLDAGQILYFEGVAEAMKQHPTEAPKVVLCIPEPSWNYNREEGLQGEDNLSTITKIATDAGARIAAVVAGDLHHYSRYQSAETGASFITAGGGGAYFSPTHYLSDTRTLTASTGKKIELDIRCKVKDGENTGEPSCWPSRGQSRWLSLSTLGFPFRNYGYSVALGAIYWVMIWMFSTTPYGNMTVGETMLYDPNFHWWPGIFMLAPLAAATNVVLGIWCLGLWVVLYGYADGAWGGKVKALLGTLHWLAHIAMMVALYYAVSYFSFWMVDTVWPQAREMLQNLDLRTSPDVRELLRTIVIFPLTMIFLGGIAAGFVWGTYLTLSCFLGLHCDQAFASMAIPDFKNFLRMKIEPNKLTIYPIGLRRTPRRWAWKHAKDRGLGNEVGPAIVPSRPLRPSLIEGPIEIRVGDLKRPGPQKFGPGIV
ncbi:MAG TPA: hypothetical protein VNR88_00350 [Hyphomicrobium sp.]|nr:hypothetical protein [Hyphomicrobium sp.]